MYAVDRTQNYNFYKVGLLSVLNVFSSLSLFHAAFLATFLFVAVTI